jgi:hypothetical protein
MKLKWKPISIRLGILLILTQDRYMVALNVPKAWKSFWTHPIEHLGDVAQVESHFGPLRDGVSLSVRYLHGLRQMYHRLRNHFGRTQLYS